MSTDDTVEVTVRGCTTYVARAGHGRDAKTASSTSSAYSAALLAARKFFRASARRTVLAYVGDQDGVIRFTAVRHASPVSFITIWFEDRGQDFLEWEIVAQTGQIIDCHPFQYTTWARCVVRNPKHLKVGDHPVVQQPGGGLLTMNYAITRIRWTGGDS